jgi:hypothetical protein
VNGESPGADDLLRRAGGRSVQARVVEGRTFEEVPLGAPARSTPVGIADGMRDLDCV